MLKQLVKKLGFPLFDIFFSPIILVAAVVLKFARILVLNQSAMAVNHAYVSKFIFSKIGVFPVIDHYPEPLFQKKNLKRPLNVERQLPGIQWDIDGQAALLKSFSYEKELEKYPLEKPRELGYYYKCRSFNPGDAEILYSMIRFFKPKRMIEIGSGMSTLLSLDAIKMNKEESGGDCELTCIEPFHMPWLEKKGVRVIRNLVENVRLDAFKELNAHDILFIDSSHIIRPQGDLLFIFLELLPVLNPGVVVHIHDIFSPADIHEGFLVTEALLYNEQYLLEAFLTCNPRFKVIAALSYLKRHFPQLMFEKCPGMRVHFEIQEPRSFWIKRIE